MKVRKLAVALALAGGLGSSLAHALGLGQAEVKSSLNEPLRAEIELVSTGNLTRDEIIASLAQESDFQRVGINPTYFLNEIKFEVVTNPQGELVLELTTDEPVREPYLNFLVEVAWPSGRLLREYAFLIDPPTYRDGGDQVVSQPAASTPAPRTAQRSDAPSRQRQAEVAPPPRGSSSPATYGPVSPSDTLWSIATSVRPSADITPQQMMLALQDANPRAFLNNNINLLQRGSVLRIPSLEEIRIRSRREAVQQVAAQNRRFQNPDQRQPAVIDGAGERLAAPQAAPAVTGGGDELRLLAGNAGGAEIGSHGGAMGGTGPGSAESRLAMTLEELDEAERERAELSSRLEALHEQLMTLQRLVELKDDQLAAMQARTMAEEAATETPAATPEQAEVAGSVQGTADTGATTPEADALGADAPAPASQEAEQSAGSDDEQLAAVPAAAEIGSEAAAGPDGPELAPAEPNNAPDGDEPALADAQTDTGAVQADTPAEAVAPAAPAASSETVQAGPKPQESGWSMRGLFQKILNNPLYQIGVAGVGIALLALLWLLARRNAKREENFYAQLQQAEAEGAYDDPSADNTADSDGHVLAAGLVGAAAMDDGEEEPRGAGQDEGEDPIAEADVYLAYGRLDQAAQVLENAISHEPSRSDLRLKLLAVYADGGNEEAFALQMSEIEALDDEAALVEAEGLRERLEASSAAPSIDDLESQLKGEGRQPEEDTGHEPATAGGDQDPAAEDDLDLHWNMDETVESEPMDKSGEETLDTDFNFDLDEVDESRKEEAADSTFDFNLDELELEEDNGTGGSGAVTEESLSRAFGNEEPENALPEDQDDFDFTLDDAELDAELSALDEPVEPAGDAGDDSDRGALLSDEELDALDLENERDDSPVEKQAEPEPASLEADLDMLEEAEADEAEPAPSLDKAAAPEGEGGTSFDDSFLEELDAELEKVTDDSGELDEPDETPEPSVQHAELDELELDVSDEDLALIEEVAGSEDIAEDDLLPEETALESDDEELLDLDLNTDDDLDSEAGEVPTVDSWNMQEDDKEAPVSEAAPVLDEPEPVTAEEPAGQDFDDSVLEDADVLDSLNEDDLGDDDDFDFLEGTDEAATKLDLARAYVEMGDGEGARDILEEVALEGDDAQKQEAQELLKKLA